MVFHPTIVLWTRIAPSGKTYSTICGWGGEIVRRGCDRAPAARTKNSVRSLRLRAREVGASAISGNFQAPEGPAPSSRSCESTNGLGQCNPSHRQNSCLKAQGPPEGERHPDGGPRPHVLGGRIRSGADW